MARTAEITVEARPCRLARLRMTLGAWLICRGAHLMSDVHITVLLNGRQSGRLYLFTKERPLNVAIGGHNVHYQDWLERTAAL